MKPPSANFGKDTHSALECRQLFESVFQTEMPRLQLQQTGAEVAENREGARTAELHLRAPDSN